MGEGIELAQFTRGLSGRVKTEPESVVREARRLGTEVDKIDEQLKGGRRPPPGADAGLLEGTG